MDRGPLQQFAQFLLGYFDGQVGKGYGVYEDRIVIPSQTGRDFEFVLAAFTQKGLPYCKVVGQRLLWSTAGLAGNLLSSRDFATLAKQQSIWE